MNKTVIFCILTLLVVIILLNSCNLEGFANNEFIWENKVLDIKIITENLAKAFRVCGVENITLDNTDFNVINSRKRLVELLPVTNLIEKLSYDQLQCFVKKFDPENYLIISKTVTTVPKLLKPINIILVNDMLYQSTPYGVLKYKIPKLSEYKGLNTLNASIECGILNDFNTYNTLSEQLFYLEGKIIQRQNKKFIDIKTNDNYEITDINNKIELLNKKIIDKINQEKAIQEKAIQEKAIQEKTIQEKTIQEKAIQEKTIQEKAIQEKTIQEKAIQEKTIQENIKKIEKMVDVGGIVELDIKDSKQLKVIDTKTFLPVVSTITKSVIMENIDPKLELQNQINKLKQLQEQLDQLSNNKQISIYDKVQAEIIVSEKEKINNEIKLLEESKTNIPIINKNNINIDLLIDNLISIFEYDGIIYMAEPNIIRPFSNWALKVNELLNTNKLHIQGIIPHFFYTNGKFNYRLIIILNDDFYIWINKTNVSEILDIKKDWGISFNRNIPDNISCDDLKIILEQMEKANIINMSKVNQILQNYRC